MVRPSGRPFCFEPRGVNVRVRRRAGDEQGEKLRKLPTHMLVPEQIAGRQAQHKDENEDDDEDEDEDEN